MSASNGGLPARPGRAGRVSLVTLGCARNEVDSEELAGRLEAAGWSLAGDDGGADVVLVNTCGFIEAAKQESIGELLDAASTGARVVAVGCLAERYGSELAAELPEAQVLSFDDYGDIAARLDDVLAGRPRPAHQPRDRRKLLPIAPAGRRPPSRPLPGHGTVTGSAVTGSAVTGSAVTGSAVTAVAGSAGAKTGSATAVAGPAVSAPAGEDLADGGIPDLPPGVAPASGPRAVRRRLSGGPVAPLKIASGCDRRCSFCAIPAFRGAFLSRPPQDLIAEAEWLAARGVRELLLVSENSTSYGKDLGNLRLLDELLPSLAAVPGIARVRVSYLQPAELRPGLITVMTGTPGVAPYFDLSFQHASGSVLRAMRRFGDAGRFLALVEEIRRTCPEAGIRSNFIVGFPGESDTDLAELERFLAEARLDAIGVFGYSDEDGTEAAALGAHVDAGEIARRAGDLAGLADELMSQRAADRIGETASVLIEEDLGSGEYRGRAAHQAPEVDGATTVRSAVPLQPGELAPARITASDGVDLLAEYLPAGPAGWPGAPAGGARPAGAS